MKEKCKKIILLGVKNFQKVLNTKESLYTFIECIQQMNIYWAAIVWQADILNQNSHNFSP